MKTRSVISTLVLAFLRLLPLGVVVAVFLLASGATNPSPDPMNSNHMLNLSAPSFIGIARAENNTVPTIIENEAGISAWLQSSFAVDLNNVRRVYRVIEAETADHIIGTVQVPNYSESEEIHVFVHREGWVLGFYPTNDPISRILDWIVYEDSGRSNISTKLENTLAGVTSAAGIPYSGVTYYDFRYPNASDLLFIIEWTGNFSVNLPTNYAYYERSWSRYQGGLSLNGAPLTSTTGWGVLTAGQLPPGQTHQLDVSGYGGLVIAYRRP